MGLHGRGSARTRTTAFIGTVRGKKGCRVDVEIVTVPVVHRMMTFVGWASSSPRKEAEIGNATAEYYYRCKIYRRRAASWEEHYQRRNLVSVNCCEWDGCDKGYPVS